MKALKKYTLLLLLLLSVTALSAQTQKSSNRFEVKFGNETKLEMKSSSALLSPDNKITIFGYDKKATPSPVFQIELVPTDPSDKRAFTKGYYLLNSSAKRLDYTPGESFNYDVKMSYILLNDENISAEWHTGISPEKGFLEIESITDKRIKGRFFCELLQTSPTKGAKQVAEGSFDIEIIAKK